MSHHPRSQAVIVTALAAWSAWCTAATRGSDAGATAKDTLARIGIARGLCVLVDEAGDLSVPLARQSELTLFVQSSKDCIDLFRRADAEGLLGTRIVISQGDCRRLHLADDLADAVVVGSSATGPGGVATAEVLRVLRPGGKALVGSQEIVKPANAGTDEWTHPYHGPDNNPQSEDQVARRPFMTHFLAEPWYCPLGQMTLISGGRMFKVFGDRSSARPQEAMLNKLLAVSAYNGTILWTRDLTPGFMIHRNTFVATPETVYLGDNKSCKVIDAATGRLRDEIVAPAELCDGPVWKWMALDGKVLLALVGEQEPREQTLRGDRVRGAGWPWWNIPRYQYGFGRTFFAIDLPSKKVRWHRREQDPIDGRAVCMKNGRLYYYSDRKFLACLDAKTGRSVWKNTDPQMLDAIDATGAAQHWMLGFASTAYMKCGENAIYFAGPQRPRLVAVDIKDGKLLWQRAGGNVQLVIHKDAVFALGEGLQNSVASSLMLQPVTGEVLATFASRDRCTRATGSVDCLFTRGGAGGSTSVFDTIGAEPNMGVLTPMRPACQDGVVPALGYLFWGPWMCQCDQTQLGIISLGPAGAFDFTAAAVDGERLERESASSSHLMRFPIDADDWPMYRKNAGCTVVTGSPVKSAMSKAWQYQTSHRIRATAPVAAGGLVLVGGSDGAVRALDAATGQLRWTAYTSGPIRYPPALADGRAYVGSGDGWIYCLEAATGRRLWRFRAAPMERYIPVYGLLAATWPVGSGVLVDHGVVYAAAGMFNYDGTHVYALDAATGSLRWQNNTSGHIDKRDPGQGVSVQGHFLLHGGAFYMSAGNQPTVASYALSNGGFTAAGTGRGQHLFVRKGQVHATGFPLYWRPEDENFLTPLELESPAGVIAVDTSRVALESDDAPKPKVVWTSSPFQEIAAVAIGRDALLVAGVDRDKKGLVTDSGVTALKLSDGKPLWKEPLPAGPIAWGLACDRAGRVIVSLTDGRLLAFASEEGK